MVTVVIGDSSTAIIVTWTVSVCVCVCVCGGGGGGGECIATDNVLVHFCNNFLFMNRVWDTVLQKH